MMDWEQAYTEYSDPLLLYARQLAASHADAEDIVQDAFVRVFTKRSLKRHPNLKAVLFQSVRWAALDRGRSARRRAKREADHHAFHECGTAEQTGGQHESWEVIDASLQELPEDQRQVLVLKLWGDFTFKEIAEQLEISPNTVASRYRYALSRLKEAMSHQETARELSRVNL